MKREDFRENDSAVSEQSKARPAFSASTPSNVPLIIGHRGAAAVAPENTLISFERALKDGADGIEFDVRLTRDNVPVVVHDATLRRTAQRAEAVAQLSAKELDAVDVGTWFNQSFPLKARPEYANARIVSLATVFERLRNKPCIFYVEMKCDEGNEARLAVEVARLVQALALHDRVVVESFEHPAIKEIKRLDVNIRTAALFDRRRTRPMPSKRWIIAQAENCGADEVALHRSLAYPRLIQEAMLRGMPSVVWTVDNALWVSRAARFGMRAIITNNPARLCARRNEIFSV
jgi:glycerophosphoryl diester phosphodiesterase